MCLHFLINVWKYEVASFSLKSSGLPVTAAVSRAGSAEIVFSITADIEGLSLKRKV